MTILHFTLPHQPNLGGLYIAQNAFKKVNHSKIVEIISTRDISKTEGDYKFRFWGLDFLDKQYGIPYGLSFPINISQIFLELSRLCVDLVVIHALFHYHSILGYWFAKKYGIPYVFVPHGTLDPYVFLRNSFKKRIWMELIGKPLIANADSVIFSTFREMEKASPILGNAQVDICNWGIEIPDLSESENWKVEMRHKLEVDDKIKVLLFLGRINNMKRPLETALAFQAIEPKGWKFIIVGYPEDKELLGQIKSECDPNYVSYYPPVEGQDKWKLIAASDAFVNLSHRENFGYSAVEAAALGLPILISDGVDLYPEFQSYNAAQVVHVENQTGLEKDLHAFLNFSPELMKAMGSRGKRLVSDKFTESAFNSRLKSLLNKYSKFKDNLENLKDRQF